MTENVNTADDKTAKITERIARMLAIAESTTHEEERDTALRGAEALMAQYGITEAMIAAKEGRAENVVHLYHTVKLGAYERPFRETAANIARALDCRTLIATMRDVYGKVVCKRITIVGYESDATVVLQLVQSVEIQAMTAMSAWWKTERRDYEWASNAARAKARASYVGGFGRRCAIRLAEQRRMATREAVATTPGAELVLLPRMAQVDESLGWGNMKMARGFRSEVDAHAQGSGWRDGKNASLGGKALDG